MDSLTQGTCFTSMPPIPEYTPHFAALRNKTYSADYIRHVFFQTEVHPNDNFHKDDFDGRY